MCIMGLGPRSCGIFENFVLKVHPTLQSVGLLLTVSYEKNWGAGSTSCCPNTFVGGAAPAPPVLALMECLYRFKYLVKLCMS